MTKRKPPYSADILLIIIMRLPGVDYSLNLFHLKSLFNDLFVTLIAAFPFLLNWIRIVTITFAFLSTNAACISSRHKIPPFQIMSRKTLSVSDFYMASKSNRGTYFSLLSTIESKYGSRNSLIVLICSFDL